MKKGPSMEDKRILIVGLGRSGVAALETAHRLGARVSVQDSKTAEEIDPKLYECLKGNHIRAWLGVMPEDMGEYDMLILSPGVSVDQPFIEEARACGAEIIGELEFAYRLCSGRFIAITGTNGKTTTTSLVGEIFKAASRKTEVVGNIGIPVLTRAENADEDTWLVTEVSSFQLETVKEFRPEVSAILNLTPDHMDRHKTMENYGRVKARIAMCQSPDQYCVFNFDDKECFELVRDCRAKTIPFSRLEELDLGAFVKDGKIVIKNEEGQMIQLCGADELKIPGTHNLENGLAAAAIAYFAGVGPEVISETLKTFAGVEHRIETCRQLRGVRFVNDSKGTNPDAAIKAIEAMEKDIILIAGGYDKKADFTQLAESFPGRVKHLLLMGQTADKIREAALKQGFENIDICGDMASCVSRAWELAEEGDVVLLSPACASWDMYVNFERRGEDFKTCVSRLEP